MTWRVRVQRVAYAMVVVGALAMASGANFWDNFFRFLF